MKILICLHAYRNLTGSELCIFEFAKELTKLGCEVTVVANVVGDPLQGLSSKFGVRVYSMSCPPGFVVKNGAYWRQEHFEQYDVLHLNHPPIAKKILQLYPDTPAIMHVHSEIIPHMEYPLLHPEIKHYLSVRRAVSDYIKSHGVDERDITIVENPIDVSRFNCDFEASAIMENAALFVGTLNPPIRRKMLLDIHEYTYNRGEELWIAGKDHGILRELTGEHVRYFGEIFNPEELFKRCKYTVGIMKGRTTIEGWLCGKDGLIYDVDSAGNIKSKKMYGVPEDVEKYKAPVAARKLLEIYRGAMH